MVHERVTSQFIMTFEAIKLLHIAYAHTSEVSVIFYCYMLQNKQSCGQSCSVISHFMLFSYRIMLNISTMEQIYQNPTKDVILHTLQCIRENAEQNFFLYALTLNLVVRNIFHHLFEDNTRTSL